MAGLGAINGQGNGIGGVSVHVTDQDGKKVGNSIALSHSQGNGGGSSVPTFAASPELPQSISAISSSIDDTLATLDTLSSSVSSLASAAEKFKARPQLNQPSSFNGQGSGLAKFALAPITQQATTAATTTATTSAGSSGGLQAGTDATVVDFGTVKINGVDNYLGAVQAPYMTSQEAAEYVVGAINSNEQNSVSSSLNDQGAIVLSSKSGEAIEIQMGGSTTGNTSQLTSIGFSSGTYGSTATAASAISSPFFAENFRETYKSGSAGTSSTSTLSGATTTTAAATTLSTNGSGHTPKGWLKKD